MASLARAGRLLNRAASFSARSIPFAASRKAESSACAVASQHFRGMASGAFLTSVTLGGVGALSDERDSPTCHLSHVCKSSSFVGEFIAGLHTPCHLYRSRSFNRVQGRQAS